VQQKVKKQKKENASPVDKTPVGRFLFAWHTKNAPVTRFSLVATLIFKVF
jgi:hypothetical protein